MTHLYQLIVVLLVLNLVVESHRSLLQTRRLLHSKMMGLLLLGEQMTIEGQKLHVVGPVVVLEKAFLQAVMMMDQ